MLFERSVEGKTRKRRRIKKFKDTYLERENNN
jgi:hypothetical protein